MSTISECSYRCFRPEYLPLQLHWLLLFIGVAAFTEIWEEISSFYYPPVTAYVGLERLLFSLITYLLVIFVCILADSRGTHRLFLLLFLSTSVLFAATSFAIPETVGSKSSFQFNSLESHPNVEPILHGGNYRCDQALGRFVDICGANPVALRRSQTDKVNVVYKGYAIPECSLYCEFQPSEEGAPTEFWTASSIIERPIDKDSNCFEYKLLDLHSFGNTLHNLTGDTNCTKSEDLCQDCCLVGCESALASPVLKLLTSGVFWLMLMSTYVNYLSYHVSLVLSLTANQSALPADSSHWFGMHASWSAVGAIIGIVMVAGTASVNTADGRQSTDWTLAVGVAVLARVLTIVNAFFFVPFEERYPSTSRVRFLELVTDQRFLLVLITAALFGFLDGSLERDNFFWYYPAYHSSVGPVFAIVAFWIAPFLIKGFGWLKVCFVAGAAPLLLQTVLVASFYPHYDLTLSTAFDALHGICPTIALSALIAQAGTFIPTNLMATAYALIAGAFLHIGQPCGTMLLDSMDRDEELQYFPTFTVLTILISSLGAVAVYFTIYCFYLRPEVTGLCQIPRRRNEQDDPDQGTRI